MECLGVAKLPDGQQWLYEIKLDGYRAEAVKSDGNLFLFPRNRKSFNRQFPLIVEALADLPDNTVIDGEVVALNDSGRPDFNLLQNFRSAESHIHYFVFDLLIRTGVSPSVVRTAATTNDARMPVRQPARDASLALG
jgi:bifunctional non-homologous end joining protein LigD